MDLNIEIFADTAHLTEIAAWATEPRVRGFTTNPTLIRAAGVTHFREWAHAALALVGDRPLSLPMLAPDLAHMAVQAQEIAAWGPNVYVKIPIQTSAGESTLPLIEQLSHDGIPLNVTAVFTHEQTRRVQYALQDGAPYLLSVFAGRIADTGCDPKQLLGALCLQPWKRQGLVIWASARQVGDVVRAADAGCDIITLPPALLLKLPTLGKDLDEYSRETVLGFERDAAELRW